MLKFKFFLWNKLHFNSKDLISMRIIIIVHNKYIYEGIIAQWDGMVQGLISTRENNDIWVIAKSNKTNIFVEFRHTSRWTSSS